MAVPSINLAGLNLSGLANLGGLGASRSVTSSAAAQKASSARAASAARPSVAAKPGGAVGKPGTTTTVGRPVSAGRPVVGGGVGPVRPGGRMRPFSREDLPPDVGPTPGQIGAPAPTLTPGEEAQQQQQRGGYERGAGLVGRFAGMGTRDGRFKGPASDLAGQLAKRKMRTTFMIE